VKGANCSSSCGFDDGTNVGIEAGAHSDRKQLVTLRKMTVGRSACSEPLLVGGNGAAFEKDEEAAAAALDQPMPRETNSTTWLWGVMHRNLTNNQSYLTFRDFKTAVMAFLTKAVPENWSLICDSVSDNFRVINPADFRVLS
jgi:hypothetical protein